MVYFFQLALTTIFYVLLGWVGLLIANSSGVASPIWPASGLALAMVISKGYRVWPGIFIGSFIVNYWIGDSQANILVSCVIASGASIQAIVGFYLLKRYANFPANALSHDKEILLFILWGGLCACVVNASIGSLSLFLSQLISLGDLFSTWVTWWSGDIFGVLIATPVALSWLERKRPEWTGRSFIVSIAFTASLMATLVIFMLAITREENQLEAEVNKEFRSVSNAIESNLQHQINNLYAVEALFNVNDVVNKDMFKVFTASILLRSDVLQAISWNQWINNGNTTSPELINSIDNNQLIVTFIEPFETNKKAVGYDILTNQERRSAIEKALKTQTLVATQAIHLIQYVNDNFGILLLLPHLDQNQNIKGFITGVIHIKTFIETALQGFDRDIFIFKLEEVREEGEDQLLYSDNSSLKMPFEHIHQLKKTIEIGGQQWLMSIQPTASWVKQRNSGLALQLIISGFLITVIIGVQILSYTARFQSTKNLMLANLEAKLAAEASNRSKSEFLANMSHEIRTPMNAVMGFTDLLEKTELDEKQAAYVSSIQSGAKGLMTILNDILDLSKIEAGKIHFEFEATDTYAFLRDIEQIFAKIIIDKNLQFEVVIEPHLPSTLIIDQTRVRQILFNLIGNAIKFTAKGFIKVIVSNVPKEDENHSLSSVDLSISVTDSGIGIKADQLDVIFEQFVQHEGQSTKEYGGTGLGLAICLKLAKLMNGSVSVSSVEGVGSTFTLHLNKVSVASIEVNQKESENFHETTRFEPAIILIADDIESNRLLIKEQFLDQKLTFIEAEDGLQAIEMVKKFKPDLVIMDIRMPKMNGISANLELKKDPETQNIPVIALTASLSKKDKEEISAGQFNHFLQKPAKKIEIEMALKLFLDFSIEHSIQQEEELILVDKALTVEQKNLLIEKLDIIFKDEYQKAKLSGMLSDIVIFASLTKQIGIEFEWQSIVSYSDILIQSAELFDIDKIENRLPEFELILTKVRQTETFQD